MTLHNKFIITPAQHKKMLKRYRELIIKVNKDCSKELDLRLVYQACIDNWDNFACFFLLERPYNPNTVLKSGKDHTFCKSRFEVLEKLFEIVKRQPDTVVDYTVLVGSRYDLGNFDHIIAEARGALEILAERILNKNVVYTKWDSA